MEIDFEDLQREISAAENYLRSAPSGTHAFRPSLPVPNSSLTTISVTQAQEAAKSGTSTSWKSFENNDFESLPLPPIINSIPSSPDSIDGSSDSVAQKSGISGWGTTVVSPSRVSANQKVSTSTSSNPPQVPTFHSESTYKKTNINATGPGKYASEKDRETLIARLLAEHGGSNPTKTVARVIDNDDIDSSRRADTFYTTNSVTMGLYGGPISPARIAPKFDSSTDSPDHVIEPSLLLDGRKERALSDVSAPVASVEGGADTLFFASEIGDDTYTPTFAYDDDNGNMLGEMRTRSAGQSIDEFAQTWDRSIPHARPRGVGGSGGGRPTSVAFTIQAEDHRRAPSTDAEKEAILLARARSASGIPSRLKNNTPREWKYVKSREDCVREGEKNLREQFSFKPTLSTKGRKQTHIEPRLLNKKDNGIESEPMQPTGRPDVPNRRIEEIVRQHEKSLQNREKLKQHVEERERAACPFQPQISKGAAKILQKKALKEEGSHSFSPEEGQDQPSLRASERLYAHARVRVEHQQWLEQQVDSARMAEYTFQPLINPNTKAMFEKQEKQFGIEHVPIHERVADLQKFKNKRLHDLRAAVEESEEQTLTFAPSIDARSRQLADRGRQSERAIGEEKNGANTAPIDVADRLLGEGRAMENRKRELIVKLEQQQAVEHAPAAPSNGTKHLAQRSEFVGASFAQRQALYQEVVEKRAQERLRADADATAEWFQPQIGKSEEIVAASRPDQFVETAAERINRLYREDTEVREYRRIAREKELYRDLTFEPVIDPVSKHLARPSTLDELVDNRRGLAVREAVRKRVQAEQEAICTFKPKIAEYVPEGQFIGGDGGLYGWDPAHARQSMDHSAISTHTTASVVASKQTINMHEPEKMAQQIRAQMLAKEEKRRQELMSREIDELRECTFAPRVVPPPSTNKSLVLTSELEGNVPVIRGLGRHLELKVLSIRKQEEQEQREQQVFSVPKVERYRKKEDGLTLVKPFQLSERDLRPSRAVEELRQKAEAEMTFIPVTDMSMRRAVIRNQARAVM